MVCVLCCHGCSTTTVCGTCKEFYCPECIDRHISGDNNAYWRHNKSLVLQCAVYERCRVHSAVSGGLSRGDGKIGGKVGIDNTYAVRLAHPGQTPMSGIKGCLEAAWRQSVARVRDYLNHVVQEIRWADKLNPFNHCPHFPFFMTHFTDSMPISSIGDTWSTDPWNSKYASRVSNLTVAVGMLG